VTAEKVGSSEPDRDKGVYGISVTAEMVGTGVQNLRLYERRGLLEPTRSAGGTRLYSAEDIDRLGLITELLADGLNLAGVAMVLDLQDDNARLRDEADDHARSHHPTGDPNSVPGLLEGLDGGPEQLDL
jgi:MerR family transcriptional regulator/heat shock protein HspR